jgi:hypothetical protein
MRCTVIWNSCISRSVSCFTNLRACCRSSSCAKARQEPFKTPKKHGFSPSKYMQRFSLDFQDWGMGHLLSADQVSAKAFAIKVVSPEAHTRHGRGDSLEAMRWRMRGRRKEGRREMLQMPMRLRLPNHVHVDRCWPHSIPESVAALPFVMHLLRATLQCRARRSARLLFCILGTMHAGHNV